MSDKQDLMTFSSSELDWYDSLEDDFEYKVESVKIEYATKIARRMDHLHISKSELAEKIGTSGPYITKVLRGDSNLTIESLVKFADAVEGELHLHISPKKANVRWFDVLTASPESKEVASASTWARSSQKGSINEIVSASA